MPCVSVIIPVYQAEKFLKNCVESVRKQTFQDWEILLVDDCCTDSSPAICDQCAAEDDRIRVFHKRKNGGGSGHSLYSISSYQMYLLPGCCGSSVKALRGCSSGSEEPLCEMTSVPCLAG